MLSAKQQALCETSDYDFSELRALFINCTLKRSPELSHTSGLINISAEIMRGNYVDVIRPVDHIIAPGVWPDMTKHGFAHDDWPDIYVCKYAHILVIGTPIWLGRKIIYLFCYY